MNSPKSVWCNNKDCGNNDNGTCCGYNISIKDGKCKSAIKPKTSEEIKTKYKEADARAWQEYRENLLSE